MKITGGRRRQGDLSTEGMEHPFIFSEPENQKGESL